MQLPDPHGHGYYTTFYLLAVLTNGLLLLWEGYRRGFALRPWLVLVAASTLALVLGSKLITHSPGDWATVLFTDAPADTARSVLGGAGAAVLTVLALRRWLGLGWQVLDALALPLCVALVVQCVGCLLTGCCFGLPTDAGWGLTYAAGTPPWVAQVNAGLLPATAAHSLPVVPTQLLAALLCAAVAAVLLVTRRRAWPVGSWLLLQTGLLLLGRFLLTFGRDAASEPVAGNALAGTHLLALQAWLLPLAGLALAAWAWRVRQPVAAEAPARVVPAGRYMLATAGLLGLTASLSATALTLPEVLVFRTLLLGVILLEASRLLTSGQRSRGAYVGRRHFFSFAPRLLPLGLTAAVFVLSSQAPAPADSTVAGVLTLSLEGQQSDYTDVVSSSGCSSSKSATEYQYSTRAVGGEARYELPHQADAPAFGVGIGVWGGREKVTARQITTSPPTGLLLQGSDSRGIYAISPFADVNFVRPNEFGGGLRVGLNIGQLAFRVPEAVDSTAATVRAIPQFAAWLGQREKVYAQTDMGVGSNCLGHYLARFGIGTGLGRRDGRYLLAGVAGALAYGNNGLSQGQDVESPGALGFVSAQFPLSKTGFSIEPTLMSDFDRNYQLKLRVNWQLPCQK